MDKNVTHKKQAGLPKQTGIKSGNDLQNMVNDLGDAVTQGLENAVTFPMILVENT